MFPAATIFTLRRGGRAVQAFLTIRKCLELFFKPKVLFARFRCPAHTGKAMVLRGHRPIVGCIDHSVLPCVFVRTGRRRSEGHGTLKRVPSLEFLNGTSERFELALRARSLCTCAEMEFREFPHGRMC